MGFFSNDIGRLGEKIAAQYLKKQGFKILSTNHHQSHNEIDIIAINQEYILFVEVKTRSVEEDLYSPYGSPASAVTKGKQRRTVLAAQQYLRQHYVPDKQPRMDVIEVYLKKGTKNVLDIHHIPNAYGK